MASIARKIYRRLLKPFLGPYVSKARTLMNKMGNKHMCYICGNKFDHFIKHRGGAEKGSDFLKKLETVGSDLDNFGCIYCTSTDRERHLFLFFEKIGLWENLGGKKVLHFAPEDNLSKKIKSHSPSEYIQADLFPRSQEEQRIDITEITLEDGSIDLLICNHVLEHVLNYKKAMKEIFRVLKNGGTAILQTPYSELLSNNFEDANIKGDSMREFFYGQKDHVRLFSKRQFLIDLENTGFKVEIIKNSFFFDDRISWYYGINRKEDLILVKKFI